MMKILLDHAMASGWGGIYIGYGIATALKIVQGPTIFSFAYYPDSGRYLTHVHCPGVIGLLTDRYKSDGMVKRVALDINREP